MKFLFYWSHKGNYTSPYKSELDIVQLEINHIENNKPRLRILAIKKVEDTFPLDKVGILLINDQTAFRGKISRPPKHIKGCLWEFVFTHSFNNQSTQLSSIKEQIKKNNNKLFTRSENRNQPHELLDAVNKVLHWNNRVESLELSDIVQGKKTHNLSNNLIEAPKYKYTQIPIRTVNINLRAEWIQNIFGYMDLAPIIARKFSGGVINTLTPNALTKKWPKAGNRLPKSEYRIIQSQLQEIKPPKTGILDIYPETTPELLDHTFEKVEKIKGKRSWFKGVLEVSWQTKQKHREVAKISLQNSLDIAEKTKTLNITLQNICEHDQTQNQKDAFFNTANGIKSIKHAIEIAKSHLVASSRCLKVEVQVPIKIGLGISLDDNIQIPHPSISGKNITGKVITCKHLIKANKAISRIIAAVTITGNSTVINSSSPMYVDQAYIEDKELKSPSGIKFYLQEPKRELTNCEGIIEDLVISNDGKTQTNHLLANQYPKAESVRNELSQTPTCVSIRLKPIANPLKTKTYNVLVNNTYQIPKAINLNELE